MIPVGAYCNSDRLRSSRSAPLQGELVVPGDKSISHRALILGGLAEGRTRINGMLESTDVLRTATALKRLGCDVRRECAGSWSVLGGRWKEPGSPLNCGNSGTSARLLMGACAAKGINARFDGDASLRARPMRRVADPLRSMGVEIQGDGLPLSMRARRLGGVDHRLTVPSAQVKSAILLAGLGTGDPVRIVEPIRSRDHTEIMLEQFGCAIERDGDQVELGMGRQLQATTVEVPGDPSSAAFLLVAAAITPGSNIVVRDVCLNPLRLGWLRTLEEMGAQVTLESGHEQGGERIGDIQLVYSELRAVHVPANRAPTMIDEYPILAIAAACAKGLTVFEGLSELRLKESDRLERIVAGLMACGVKAAVERDRLLIRGVGDIAGGASIMTHGDHRIAMSFLVLGCASRMPIEVDRADMIDTSFPDFDGLMCHAGAHVIAA